MNFMTMTNKFDKKYWEERYYNDHTGWNIGYPSTPLKNYIDQLKDKNIKILIPGGGNGYEAEYLWLQGFKNVFIADIANPPLKHFKERVRDFPIRSIIKC